MTLSSLTNMSKIGFYKGVFRSLLMYNPQFHQLQSQHKHVNRLCKTILFDPQWCHIMELQRIYIYLM